MCVKFQRLGSKSHTAVMNEKIENYLLKNSHETPFLVLDLQRVVERYRLFKKSMPKVNIYYAVKANPAEAIVSALASEGSFFDIGSIAEMHICKKVGVKPGQMSYGHTIKKENDIALAHRAGLKLFAFDSQAELEKLARAAPGSRVYCRIATSGDGADWPLSKKFGCTIEIAKKLMQQAKEMALKPCGFSFHVGSQQTNPSQWDTAISIISKLFFELENLGLELDMLNLGGGLPANYLHEVPTFSNYSDSISTSLRSNFGDNVPRIIMEPGRGLVGDAGIIQTEVVLVVDRHDETVKRWIYLDIGKFGGLPETTGEAIKYRLRTPRDGGKTIPCILAGPTCDELDILYEKTPYFLPEDLQIGDRIIIESTGAYTWSYSAVCFNGILPLRQYII